MCGYLGEGSPRAWGSLYLKMVQGGPPDPSATPAPGIQALGSPWLGSETRFFPVNPTSRLLKTWARAGTRWGRGAGGPRWNPRQGDSDAGTLAHRGGSPHWMKEDSDQDHLAHLPQLTPGPSSPRRATAAQTTEARHCPVPHLSLGPAHPAPTRSDTREGPTATLYPCATVVFARPHTPI